MVYAPDGTMLDITDEGEQGEEEQNPNGAPLGGEQSHRGTGDRCGRPPYHVRGCGGRGGLGGTHRCGGTGEYDLEPPKQPNILNQLEAALHNAGLEGNPQHP